MIDLLIIGIHIFSLFFSKGLSQFYDYSREVNELTRVDLDIIISLFFSVSPFDVELFGN
jgi:hypothetical protein